LALLAFACFPVLAHAGVPNYTDAPPDPTGDVEIQERSEPPAHSSNTGGGGSGSVTGEGSGKRDGSGAGSADGRSSGPGAGGASDGGKGQGGQANGSGNGQEAPVAGAATAATSDEGASPLIPILIAIAVLAAISVGVVLMRQRRHGDDEPGVPVSPRAG
jgi:cobalamin biosynthesis Mg chelatase CobN